jgi:hypothetical protein
VLRAAQGRHLKFIGLRGSPSPLPPPASLPGSAFAVARWPAARINRALTMWCDHLGAKAVTFLVHHVNRATHLWAASNRAMPSAKVMAASHSQHDPARVLALVG